MSMMSSLLIGLVLILASCGETTIYADQARCVEGEEVVYEGPVKKVVVTDHATAIYKADDSRLIFTGRDIQCVVERETPSDE